MTAPTNQRPSSGQLTQVAYIPQRFDCDCGVAALAMATFTDYETVAATMNHDTEKTGVNDLHLKAWLVREGWAWQEIFRNYPKNGSYEKREPWPPAPFAETHIVQVEATRGAHFTVMDGRGSVFDPWNVNRNNLMHPDYKSVHWVMGLWKVRFTAKDFARGEKWGDQ